MEKSKETTITFRTSEKLKKDLAEIAEKNRRSLSNQIEVLLEDAVKSEKEKK